MESLTNHGLGPEPSVPDQNTDARLRRSVEFGLFEGNDFQHEEENVHLVRVLEHFSEKMQQNQSPPLLLSDEMIQRLTEAGFEWERPCKRRK